MHPQFLKLDAKARFLVSVGAALPPTISAVLRDLPRRDRILLATFTSMAVPLLIHAISDDPRAGELVFRGVVAAANQMTS